MASTDIEESKFKITLNNISTFTSFRSEVFYVQDNAWAFKIRKDNDLLRIVLQSENKNIPKNKVIMAFLSVKFVSFDDKKEIHCSYTGLAPFTSDFRSWRIQEKVSWNYLIDPANKFIEDNKCHVEISVKATSLIDTKKAKLMSFKTTKKCCDSSSNAMFRIKVKNIYEFFGASSPTFTLNNIPWRIAMYRNKCDRSLSINLHNLKCKMCTVKVSLKISSFNKNVESIKIDKELKYDFSATNKTWQILPWKDLVDSNKNFIKNNSFTIEVDMKIVETEEMDKNTSYFTLEDDKDISYKWRSSNRLGDLGDRIISCGRFVSTYAQRFKDILRPKRCSTCTSLTSL